MARITCTEGNRENFQKRGWKEIESFPDPEGGQMYVFETDPGPETPEPPRPKKSTTRFGG